MSNTDKKVPASPPTPMSSQPDDLGARRRKLGRVPIVAEFKPAQEANPFREIMRQNRRDMDTLLNLVLDQVFKRLETGFERVLDYERTVVNEEGGTFNENDFWNDENLIETILSSFYNDNTDMRDRYGHFKTVVNPLKKQLIAYALRSKEPESLTALRAKLKNQVSTSSMPDVEKLRWKILPPGEHPFPEIMQHYKNLQSVRRILDPDLERFYKLESLKPTVIYSGIDEFEGYFVFYFKKVNIAVLDNPLVGNAIYIIKGDWESLSRLTKKELLKGHSDNVTRIVHKGDWLPKVIKVLES